MEYKRFLRPTWSRRSTLPLNEMRQVRAGILPVIKIGEELWFCFGINSKSKEISDFAGAPCVADSNIEDTALRKCREESLGVFGISRRDIVDSDAIYVYDDLSVDIFVPLTRGTEDPSFRSKSVDEFSELSRIVSSRVQMNSLIWLSQGQLIEIISKKKPMMKKRLRCLIRDISKIIPVLDASFPSLTSVPSFPSVASSSWISKVPSVDRVYNTD